METHSTQNAGPRPFQVPPIENNQSVRLHFTDRSNQSILAMIATGSNPNLGSAFKTNEEYWYSQTPSFKKAGSLVMTLETGAWDADAINKFFNGLTAGFSTEQDVSAAGWNTGMAENPGDDKTALFQALDPDNETAHIGLLLFQDSKTRLVRTAWYKSVQPADGWIWQPANAPTTAWNWTLVCDPTGNPSHNPKYIDPTVTWYYFTQS